MGVEVRTLPRPDGELLCRFATVNDVHFGEEVCGIDETFGSEPVFRAEPGEPPYPEMMNVGRDRRDHRDRPRGGDRQGRPHRGWPRRGVRRLSPVLRRRVRRSPPHRAGQPRQLPRADLRERRPRHRAAGRARAVARHRHPVPDDWAHHRRAARVGRRPRRVQRSPCHRDGPPSSVEPRLVEAEPHLLRHQP